MRILVVGLVNAPQVGRLREEGQRRGHEVDGCFSNEITLDLRGGTLIPRLRARPMAGYDVYFFWAMDRHKHEWFTAAYHLAHTTGATVVDRRLIDPRFHAWTTPSLEYLAQTVKGLRYPASAMVASPYGIEEILAPFTFPVIVKGSLSRQGRGVHLCKDLGEVVTLMKENRGGYPAWIVREFIPNDGDVRVFTIGYRTIGAMKRTAKEGDFRSNISQGGTGAVFDLVANPRVKDMGEAISRALRIEVAGVDIMLHRETGDPYLLEVNSGPEIAGIERYTGTNVAGGIIEYFEALRSGRSDPMEGVEEDRLAARSVSGDHPAGAVGCRGAAGGLAVGAPRAVPRTAGLTGWHLADMTGERRSPRVCAGAKARPPGGARRDVVSLPDHRRSRSSTPPSAQP